MNFNRSKEDELAALVSMFHFIAQRSLPIALIGAGLPQVRGQLGRAKSYAERMFDFPQIDALSSADATTAISKPALQEGVGFEPAAIDNLVSKTKGYHTFSKFGANILGIWPKIHPSQIKTSKMPRRRQLQTWTTTSLWAIRSPTQLEKIYCARWRISVRGPHRSGDIAKQHRARSNVGRQDPVNLIAKGMIWSPTYGDTAFTAPMFDEFMTRNHA